jgi:hypothetical protein
MDNDILAQASQAALRAERLSRERDAYLYTCAWDRGDLEAVCAISDRAEHDPELREILDDLDTEFFAEEMEKEAKRVSKEEAKRVQEKLQHLMKQYYEERG